MNHHLIIFVVIFSIFVPLSQQQSCVAVTNSPEYVTNGGFESGNSPWNVLNSTYDSSFVIPNSNGGCDSYEATITATTLVDSRGFNQQIILSQTSAAPIVASAWSYAVGVDGTDGADYSIYADLTYQDNTNEWGLFTPFPVSSSGWVQRTIQFTPSKPILSLFLHLIFRNHLGTVYFDEVSLTTETVAACEGYDCGAAACCHDVHLGLVCYDPTTYSCAGGVSLCPFGFQTCEAATACYNPQYYSCSEDDLLVQGGTVPPLFCNSGDINPCNSAFECCGGLCFDPEVESCSITPTTTTTIPAGSTPYEPVDSAYVGAVCCWCTSSYIGGFISQSVPAITDCTASFTASTLAWPTDGLECRVWSTYTESSGLTCGYPVAPS